MITPFIGAIFNCSLKGGLAMQTLTRINVETLGRAEYVANIKQELCTGCGLYEVSCQFGTITSSFESGRDIAFIDTDKCFGCGLCRRACGSNAILLLCFR